MAQPVLVVTDVQERLFSAMDTSAGTRWFKNLKTGDCRSAARNDRSS